MGTEMIYKNEKVVPKEIEHWFNAISLAHLIMGDGNFLKERNLIRIYTNSFIKNDVEFLSFVMYKHLHIKSEVLYDRNNQYILVIKGDNVDITRNIVLPYMHPSFLYKVGINKDNLNLKFNYFNIKDYI